MSIIKQVSKLKKFGIFDNFNWNSDLPEFKKFNLIYGWNRSGKTTLSRIFASCEKKSVYDKEKFKQFPEHGEFEIKTDDGSVIKSLDIATSNLKVKVFNQDFIDGNISFDPSNSCTPIVFVSEEDIENKKKLDQLRNDKMALDKTYELLKKDKLSKEDTKSIFLTDLGREISNALFDKTYNKTKAESKINAIGFNNFTDKILSMDAKIEYESVSKSNAGKPQSTLAEYKLSIVFEDETIESFQKIYENITKLLGKKVISDSIDRLKDDQSLNSWVKQGFELHKSKNEKHNCLFCSNPIDAEFLNTLSGHFSKDYEDLQSAIVIFKNEINKIKLSNEGLYLLSTKAELYPDLQGKFEEQSLKLEEIIDKTNTWIETAISKLNEKYNSTLIIISNPDKPEEYFVKYNSVIKELNKIIEKHNDKIQNHSKEVSNSKEKIELHLIATALKSRDYPKMISEFEDSAKIEKQTLQAVNKLNMEIAELEKQTSNIGKAIRQINKHLKEFFGKEEILLELDKDKKGYIINREGDQAINLSEGEKTAIAFSYFLVKVGENDSKSNEQIVFIDDPISSFDSNFIFHCFSLIKNHFTNVGQLFISTHNFQLFNLVKDWFVRKNKGIEDDNKDRLINGKPVKEINCEFYMIKPILNESTRKSKFTILDSTLRDYKSEYSFLFSLLNEFSKKSEEPTFEEIYNIANIGRRFFEIYADFKVPTNKIESKDKIDRIVAEINKLKENEDEKISKVDCDKVFWLINWFSHNSDPTSAIEHKDKSESKDAIKILLKIVKESDPKHFEILLKS
ncbi:MAG: AAA family ATPase [Saprospiraceae bacterium]|nr:AAA family ATPase [Saprospiraceae bacterium]